MFEKTFCVFLHTVYFKEQLERKMNHRQLVGNFVCCLLKCIVGKRKHDKFKFDEL